MFKIQTYETRDHEHGQRAGDNKIRNTDVLSDVNNVFSGDVQPKWHHACLYVGKLLIKISYEF